MKVVAVSLLAVLLVVVIFDVLWLWLYGSAVPRPGISRNEQTIGQGPKLRFVVLGDSTAVSQGGEYERGYAVAAARHLAKTHQVVWRNVAEPGARAMDVLERQVPQVLHPAPDVVLIAVGANDVTHGTPLGSVYASLEKTIHRLQKANSAVRIVLTGSPDMGSLTRLPQPLRWLAGQRTKALNRKLQPLIQEPSVVFAPIADLTGPVFRAHPELLAADKFHATTEGYELWTPIILAALDRADR